MAAPRGRWWVVAAVAMLGCLLLPRTAPAEAPDAARLRWLVGQLGGNMPQTEREQAVKELAGAGEPALDVLRDAAATAADPAVRDGARDLVAEIEHRRPGAAAFAKTVEDVTAILLEDSVLDLTPADIVEAAVPALYDLKGRPLPPDLAARLRLVRILDETQLHGLLWDAAARLDALSPLDPKTTPLEAASYWLGRLDPYADWIGPDGMRLFNGRESAPAGVGLRLRQDSATGLPLVVLPLKGGPAYRAGVRSGDLLTRITQMEVEGKSVAMEGLTLDETVRLLLGPSGSKVRLTVRRKGRKQPLEFEMLRGPVELETVLGVRRGADDEWDYWLDRDTRIGYIRVIEFNQEVCDRLRAVVEGLKRDGLKGLVLDLRFNPGGLLTAAVDVADLFIDDGVIVSIQPRIGPLTKFEGKHEGSLLRFPMVCLINGETSSGAEIVAACLQDHGRAVIVGERSRGKGNVQNLRRFGDGQLKITTACFIRPNGKSLNRCTSGISDADEWGVIPNPGFAVNLGPNERFRLRDHLEDLTAIPPREVGTAWQPRRCWDAQLAAALSALRPQAAVAARRLSPHTRPTLADLLLAPG